MYKDVVKPLIDFVLAFICTPFLALLCVPIALAIKIEDGGPVFYCTARIGRHGKPFKLIKFRSMKVNAPDLRLADGSTYNAEDDPRVTKVGRFLRKTSIDELPQIVNILAFEMSFVGPRPDPVDWLARYKEDENGFLKVRPGITGYNQAYFRNEADGALKIVNDNYYAKRIGLFFDLRILCKTMATILKRDSVYVSNERVKGMGRGSVAERRDAGAGSSGPHERVSHHATGGGQQASN